MLGLRIHRRTDEKRRRARRSRNGRRGGASNVAVETGVRLLELRSGRALRTATGRHRLPRRRREKPTAVDIRIRRRAPSKQVSGTQLRRALAQVESLDLVGTIVVIPVETLVPPPVGSRSGHDAARKPGMENLVTERARVRSRGIPVFSSGGAVKKQGDNVAARRHKSSMPRPGMLLQ